MTTWEIVDDSGVQVSISAEGRKRYEDEQQKDRAARVCAEVRIWCVAASIPAIAALVIAKLFGA